jgi:hypothetical protein
MKKVVIQIILFLLFVGSAPAQDFKKIIQIVGEMEESLKKKITDEESLRVGQTTNLQKQVDELRSSINEKQIAGKGTVDSGVVVSLTQRLENVENKMSNKEPTGELLFLIGKFKLLIGEMEKTNLEGKKLSDTALTVGGAKTSVTPVPSSVKAPSIKVGFLAQVQAQTVQDQTTAAQDADPKYTQHWQRQIFIRRLRVLVGGDLGQNTTFFFESDAPNLGKVATSGTKDSKMSMYVQDAQIQHTVCPEFSVIAGLQLVGITRNSLQGSTTLMAVDYGAYQFIPSTPLDNFTGRDLGVNLRGFLINERLEYRLGMFSGKNINLYSPFRTTLRLNYNLLDREKGFFLTGSTLGKGQIAAIGGGLDVQGSYFGLGIDGFCDLPLFGTGSVTLSTSFAYLDGGGSDHDSTMFTGLIPKQSLFFAELGYIFKDLGLQPYVKYDLQKVHATVLKQVKATESTLDLQNALQSGNRLGFGLNYFLNGHNTSVKLLYELIFRHRAMIDATQYESATNSAFTLQLQYYMY